MDLEQLKSLLPPVFNQICQEIRINDAVIEWVDIIFEQIGTASKCPPHAHTWFEFNYILSGQMVTHFGDELVQVGEGDFFLIPPGTIHSHSYTRGNPHEGICLRWRIRPASTEKTDVQGESFFTRLQRLQEWNPGSYRDNGRLHGLLEQFFLEALTGQSELALQLLLIHLLEYLSLLQMTMQGQVSSSTAVKDPLVRKVEVYLEDFQSNRLSVGELAASLHMSYGHLSRQYKKLTGQTIINRMNQIRLEKAKELMKLPGLRIAEIAEQAGFADLCYFSRAFKKHYGASPQNYRRQTAATEST
ncbi:AraC family transcriptional regulator [Paenibacillus sp. HWE-109]|uniref:AraC family transcriptional regulator n=1 Tax=Paenibacillus sp. HWE-109 TaxID=1306526 RepID=UPI001EDE8595|nr:helix-turn-helix domain-containing protein [Paenibacillus sp. HWE-109]UKS28467.1 AraC family transcriptional regulator [Paenibacillus sp. HWE-109]